MTQAEIKQVPWDERANEAFEKIELDYVDLDHFEDMAAQQKAALYGCFLDGVRVGSVLVFYEDYQKGSVMVLCMAGQNEQGRNRCPLFFPFFEELALKKGCRWVRGHTDRKGMMVEVAKLGYQMKAIEYQKDLSVGR